MKNLRQLFSILLAFVGFYSKISAQNISDPKAIQIADEVMNAMGGKKAFDNTHHVTWNFFGARRLVWDKWTGNVRIDNLKDNSVILVNVNTGEGKVFKYGQEQTSTDSLKKYLKMGKSQWINDSYWLMMPYKLRDEGVTLKYLGQEKTADNKDADVLQLTFEKVGDTPDNKYKVYVDPATHMVCQFAYFPKNSMEKPAFVRPWTDWKPYGKIMLSGERGDRDLTEIKVFEMLPDKIYHSFDKPDFSKAKDYNTKKDHLE